MQIKKNIKFMEKRPKMKQKNQYTIKDQNNENYFIRCCVETDPENTYDTTYYFHDTDNWIKDFIDITKLAPTDKQQREEFDTFITHIHDYMVHGNLWEDLSEIKPNTETKNDKYQVIIVNDTQ